MRALQASLPGRLASLLALVAAWSSLVARLPAQALAVGPPACHADRLELKLAEGTGAEWRDGRLVSRVGADLSTVSRLLALAADVDPLVTAVSWDQLDRWHRRACAVLPENNRPGHLGLWFRLRATSPVAAAQLLAQLAEQPLVEHVYLAPHYYPAAAAMPVPTGDLPPTTPAFMAQQYAHGPTPAGHGVRAVGGILGARGQGVGLRMIETSWILGHEDVCQLVPANFIGPVPAVVANEANHGLSGTSIVLADRNSYGVTGIADEVEAQFISLELNNGIGNAMALAMSNSQPGDVVMIVIMVLVPALGPGTWLPVEFIQSAFDATLTATANGLHVVVPAGNGNRSLDDPALLSRFDRNFRDSGAVIVAASNAGAMQRAPFSNWGSRVDAHSWGDQVVSCGYGTLFQPNGDPLQAYTAAATGTSSSCPHLVGLVAALQGAAQRQLGQVLSNQELLDLLHNYGPSTPDVIGRRPDMVAMLQSLGVFDGLAIAEPDVGLGGTITVTMDGPPGSLAGLFGGFATANVPLGFNRNVHLDPSTMNSVGGFLMPSGSAQYLLPVPNNAALHGVDIYFQAVRLTATQPLHLTNSCQVTIL